MSLRWEQFRSGYRWQYNLRHPIRYILFKVRCVKWFLQRGFRGYADSDVWSIDWYVNQWMPRAIRQLKDTQHGYPFPTEEFFPALLQTHPNDIPKEVWDAWHVEWKRILEQMARGFEAADRMNQLEWWDGTDLKPRDTPEGEAQWKELEDTMKLGFELFAKHYQSLWD